MWNPHVYFYSQEYCVSMMFDQFDAFNSGQDNIIYTSHNLCIEFFVGMHIIMCNYITFWNIQCGEVTELWRNSHQNSSQSLDIKQYNEYYTSGISHQTSEKIKFSKNKSSQFSNSFNFIVNYIDNNGRKNANKSIFKAYCDAWLLIWFDRVPMWNVYKYFSTLPRLVVIVIWSYNRYAKVRHKYCVIINGKH